VREERNEEVDKTVRKTNDVERKNEKNGREGHIRHM